MADNKSASGTSQHTVAEIKEWYDKNKLSIENYAKAKASVVTLRDVTKPGFNSVRTINKEEVKRYFENVAAHEQDFRKVARYLYYRSNIIYRIVNWYTGMWDLRCRQVIPSYDFIKEPDPTKMLKQYDKTLKVLDCMDLPGNMPEVLNTVYREDVCYAISYMDDTGMFFYILDPDECMIDGRYLEGSGDFSFSVDMSKWKNSNKQKIIEFLGSPLKEMWDEYVVTKQRWVHCPDEYAACFKFRSDTWDVAIPPFVPLLIQLAGLEDLVDIQGEADELDIYKLIYMPLETISGSKDVDDFAISPDIARDYFQKFLDTAAPQDVAGAIIPGKELKTIDFQRTVDSDVTSVEKASNQILQTAGGGAVINANKITTNAAFKAWLLSETRFAMTTLLPQIKSYKNRMLAYKVNNPARVDYFQVSVYTKDDFAESLLKSCQYSFANRLAYNTCLGISERATLAMLYFENSVLNLPEKMQYPLSSSFTTSGEVGQGAPKKDDGDLSDEGDRSRNR